MSISQVLSSTLFVPQVQYKLQNIYIIVNNNASTAALNGDWHHVVRGILSNRKVTGRTITYHGNAHYSFS